MERADFKYYDKGFLVYVTRFGQVIKVPASDVKLYRTEDLDTLLTLVPKDEED
jgi:hypothetical protein